tara:strand:+ start:3347 stop:4423 length:1077 start_codon:yes stop_codon:yes gene_type:complete
MRKTPLICLLLTLAPLASSPLSASATIADGVRAYEVGDYERAREEWLPYAALGNPNALYNLGQLYRMGRGVEQDYARAAEYYLRAAGKGHVGAQRNLGTLYYFGRGGKKDLEKAMLWLSRAAANGDARAQNMVGIMHYTGEGAPQDRIKAYAWISLSARQGLGDAIRAEQQLRPFLTDAERQEASALAPTLVAGYDRSDNTALMVNGQEEDEISQQAASEVVPTSRATPEASLLPAPGDGNESAQAGTIVAPSSSEKEAPENILAKNILAEDLYRVQIGAYRRQEEARAAGDHLTLKYPDILGPYGHVVETVDLGPDKGVFYRLQLRPFASREEANALCTRLSAAGQSCFVLKTPNDK